MQIFKTTFQDRHLLRGVIMLFVSLLVFSLPLFLPISPENYFGLFVVHYVLSVVYWISILAGRRYQVPSNKVFYPLISLLLFLVSAYALNRDMNVFNASPAWLCFLILGIGAVYLAALFFKKLPVFFQYLVLFLLGLALLFFIYLAIYLIPVYAISAIGLLVLGISIHSFVPAFFIWHTLKLVSHLSGSIRRYWVAFSCGMLATLFFIIAFCSVWQANTIKVNNVLSTAMAEGNEALPAWIAVAQQLPRNSMTEKLLKTDLLYHVPAWNEDIFWSMPRRTFGEEQPIHDPLVIIGSYFSGPLNLDEEDRLSILNASFDSRHHAEERLWTGVDLTTTNVHTLVRIWPGHRIAYTEKILTVENHQTSRWAGRQQEAIYTFHLPEGGVVTSLSLWINGKEEKGILTTKGKADNAYRTIVGSEQRDPSVVHWQEGSRVSVRVFPVMAGGNRVFKIGVTTPLRKEGTELVYDNIYFDGPDAGDARETIRIRSGGNSNDNRMRTVVARKDGAAYYEHIGNYRSRWSHRVPDKGLTPAAFGYNGYAYSIIPYQKQIAPAAISDIYLDINAAWTRAEFNMIIEGAKGRRVWVYDDIPVQLDASNRDAYFDALVSRQFSLFPLFQIPDPGGALLVSKSGTTATPNLDDLRNSGFYKSLKNYPAKHGRLRLFHLGGKPSAYLSTLKDYRFFFYDEGTAENLKELLASGRFVEDSEKENSIVLHGAEATLVKTPGAGTPGAPDHLLRLFTYNHLLKQYGKDGIDNAGIEDSLLTEAQLANVVTPVSSLVVLESQADYDRFGIERSKQGLQNATLKSKGAVPEPHEWVMICILGVTGFYLLKQRRRSWLR